MGGTASSPAGREVRTLNNSAGRKQIAEGKICFMVERNRSLIELIIFALATLYCDQNKGQRRVGHVTRAGLLLILLFIESFGYET